MEEIDAAFARLHAGTYGEGESCGASIPPFVPRGPARRRATAWLPSHSGMRGLARVLG